MTSLSLTAVTVETLKAMTRQKLSAKLVYRSGTSMNGNGTTAYLRDRVNVHPARPEQWTQNSNTSSTLCLCKPAFSGADFFQGCYIVNKQRRVPVYQRK